MPLYENIKNIIKPDDALNLLGTYSELSSLLMGKDLPELKGNKRFSLGRRGVYSVVDVPPVVIAPHRERFYEDKEGIVTEDEVARVKKNSRVTDTFVVLKGLPYIISAFKEDKPIAAYKVSYLGDITNSLPDEVLSGIPAEDLPKRGLSKDEKDDYQMMLANQFWNREREVLKLNPDSRLLDQIISKYFSN